MRVLCSSAVIVLTCLKIGFSQVDLDQSGARGRLDVDVTNCFGSRIATAAVSVRPVNARGDLHGKEMDLSSLVYGTYELAVEAPGYVRRVQQIIVGEPAVRLMVCLSTEPPEGIAQPMTAEFIAPPNEVNCDTAVVIPALRPNVDLPKVYRRFGNRFKVDGLPPGTYLVALMKEGRVCSAHVVDLRVGHNPPSALH